MNKEKYIGEAALKDKPGKKLTLVIKDGSVTTPKIADENVTTEKVASEAITSDKLAEFAVTESKLENGAVVERVIDEGAVTASKIASGAVETDKIANENVTNEKLAEDSVTTSKIKNESVTTEKLAESSVETSKIKDGAVTNDKIANDTLTRDKLDPELRNTLDAATGLPEDLMETIQNVDKTLKDHQSQLDDKQSQIDDKQQQITANDDDISLLQTRSTQMEEAIKGISASGGASQASAVTYENTDSGLVSVTAQGAIDELTNKKFNKENIAQEFGDSKDKVVSQFALPFREIESPEFIKAIVDAEDHFLLGIQIDGSIEWGKGIPAPIRAKLQGIINQCQQNKTDILEVINAAKKELSASITALQESKVDKEEGKSLIDDEVKECFRVIENEEFIKAIVDAEDKVLFGFYRATGEPYYPLNEMYHVIQNEEYFAAWVTTDDKVVLGIRRDGEIIGEIHAVNALKQVISQLQSDLSSLQEKVGTIDTNLKELLDIFSLQENPEYMAVEKDDDGRVLSATYNDGSHYIHNAKSETIPTEFEHIEDPEGRMEITTDGEDKVISYRDADGKKHEHDMEITNLDVSNLNLQGNSVNNIQDALKANGFDVKTPIDWSESSFIQIPEPRFAIINITNIDSMPTTKTDNKKAFLEFWDMQGNYFKKRAIINAQGNSSMAFKKKNAAIDLCDDEWIGDNTAKVRIGNWVPQDSFHMKAYYTDFFRGVGAVSYKLYDQIVRTRGNMYDRPWKKALLDMSKIDTTTKSLGNLYVGDYSLLTDTGARCFPDGFPVAVYFKDKFYGIFSFQLKKHRDNYHMDKSTAEHVHLDGVITYNSLWNGNIVWEDFEIRNPKNLYAIGGNKYDADIKQEEIAGEDEVNAWITAGKLPDGTSISSNVKKHLQITVKVKKYIQGFADSVNLIKEAASTYESSNKSEDDLKTFKQVFEKYYDVENLIDYIIVSDLINNADGFSKNWQWFTYDGVKWWVGLYDCDMSFGGYFQGNQTLGVLWEHLYTSTDTSIGYIIKYYTAELNARYKYLADKGIVSGDNIFSLLKDWCMRIGTDFFKKEYKKWADSPCIADSIVRSEYWETVLDGNGTPQTDTRATFDATIAYNVGDVVSFGINAQIGFFKFKCIKTTTALAENIPYTISAYSPIKEFKHCDNIYRVQKWIERNTANMDKVYNYSRNY
nr:MAG TPA: CotH kinase protein [Crassvirales sp.]